MKKVTGLGGVFFKCADPKGMNDWYAKNLGLTTSEYGTIVDEIAEYDYGKFVHILDPEGNIIELWEPKEELGNQS